MTRALWLVLSLLCAGAFPLSSGAQSAPRPDYIELSPPQPTSNPDRIVVTEFFSYQCPHCYSFFPSLHSWAGEFPDDVVFERVADSIGIQSWVPISRAFYALRLMGRIDGLDAGIFRAIHVQGNRLSDKESIADWVAGRGIDKSEFIQIYDAFSVDTAVRRAEQQSVAHRINSIPTLVVDGRFVVPIVDDGVFDSQLDTVDRLIDRVRSERNQ